MVDGRDSAWRNRAPGPHTHRDTVSQAMDGLWTEVRGQPKQSNDPGNNQHILNMPTIGLRERGNDTNNSTGRSGRQKAKTRCNMRREERMNVHGPVKEQQPDGMSHRGVVVAVRGRVAVVAAPPTATAAAVISPMAVTVQRVLHMQPSVRAQSSPFPQK